MKKYYFHLSGLDLLVPPSSILNIIVKFLFLSENDRYAILQPLFLREVLPTDIHLKKIETWAATCKLPSYF